MKTPKTRTAGSKLENISDGLVTLVKGGKTIRVKPMHEQAYLQHGYTRDAVKPVTPGELPDTQV